MRQHILLGSLIALALPLNAVAADLPVKAPVAPAAPYAQWTGPYVGLNLGWARQQASSDYAANANAFGVSNFQFALDHGIMPRSSSQNADGVLGGLTLGYNFQSGAFVYGI